MSSQSERPVPSGDCYAAVGTLGTTITVPFLPTQRFLADLHSGQATEIIPAGRAVGSPPRNACRQHPQQEGATAKCMPPGPSTAFEVTGPSLAIHFGKRDRLRCTVWFIGDSVATTATSLQRSVPDSGRECKFQGWEGNRQAASVHADSIGAASWFIVLIRVHCVGPRRA